MRVAGTIFWMAYTIVLARTLPAAGFAGALYVVNFSLVAVLVITMGRNVSLLRIASQAWGTQSAGSIHTLHMQSRKILLFSGALFTLCLLVMSFLTLDMPVTQSPYIATLTGLITSAAAQMGLNRDCLRAVGKIWQSQLGFNLIRTVIPTLGTFVVSFLGEMSLEIALTLFFVSLCLSLIVEETVLKYVFAADLGQEPLPGKPGMINNGLMIWPGDIANAIQMRAAGLLAGATLQPEAAALFLAAERIANLAQFPIAAASQAAAPKIARSALSENDVLQPELNKGSVLMLIGACLGAGGAAVIAWPALLAIGPTYVAAMPIAMVLIFAHLSWALFGLAQPSLHLTGRFKSYSTIAVSACIISFAFIFIGTKFAGGIGAAAGYCLGWWLTNLTYTLTYRYQTGCRTGISAFQISFIMGLLGRIGRERNKS